MTQAINEVRTKEKMERDPVCGMSVDPGKAAAKVEHSGKTYYFCAPGCAKRFQQAPEKYLQSAHSAPSTLVSLHAASQSSHSAALATDEAEPAQHPASVVPAHGHAEHKPISEKSSPAGKQVRYTCPMHPEIVQIGPRSSPICGMALDPMDVFAEVEADPEYDSMRLRFWVSAALSLPVLLLSMLGESLGLHLTSTVRNGIEFLLATPVVLWVG